MEKLMRRLFDDKSVVILNRIISKKENHFMNGLWSGTAHKMVR
ncbi:hypothetical protein MASR2M70_10180 [Bacillota bacterium]